MLFALALALAAPEHRLMKLDREGKDPLRTMVRWEPSAETEPRPVIVWSHGLGASHESYEPLVRAWVEAGYVVVQPTHDDSLLGLSRKQIQHMLKNPPVDTWRQRPLDIRHILDVLPTLGESLGDLPPLDLERIGMGGHSFGAYTAMLVAGIAAERLELDDPRPAAFVWLSPAGIDDDANGPPEIREGHVRSSDFASVDRPLLFITGSKDRAEVRSRSPTWRMTSWTALDAPATLWFVEGAHHNFGGITGRVLPKVGPADPQLVTWVARSTTAFWDTTLRGAPKGPWLEPVAAKTESKGRVRVEHKRASPPSD